MNQKTWMQLLTSPTSGYATLGQMLISSGLYKVSILTSVPVFHGVIPRNIIKI